LARALCDRAARALVPALEVVAIVGRAREQLKRRLPDRRLRAQAIATLLEEDLMSLGETQGVEAVRRAVQTRLDEVLGRRARPPC
jgi:hypothetical protein